ncbi:exodeoxyribonuclease V subunit alpha [Stenotrophomonas panacihumi]|uniref:RecBCD enzyme subunit RecD n=1 Tax=Stenotrophomonas panacihumi TaxID=676599 RepID=A0A0R0A977_9GAMM|nr:exodeoxyribonuclease V subunit alpha [Stenotrophomonas panacihumi]KRG37889.1 exodeoxyribonuclease V subunit alpha [Stenotrophomonas panacihumi]PTN56058.1 exodeoxyribonuclease V subunit alpha [Stenotrophomonas panacihumi]
MSLLAELLRAGLLRPLDHALAQSLRRLDPLTPEPVLLGAALASLSVAQGHAAFDPARPSLLVDAQVDWPSPSAWETAWIGSPWIAAPVDSLAPSPADVPLVHEGGLLYLRRYREYESRLAAGLLRLAASPVRAGDPAALADVFARLFPQARQGEDRQAWAAALALRRSLLLVTGGPGTGKTTTIARLLALRVAQAREAGQAPPRIALAAPTGRAAERMAESLRAATLRLRAEGGLADITDALPDSASTLHRLLGTVPDRPQFRHHADNPLEADIVVVDEASMVDLPLMCKLVEAVADGTQLILLGDPDQLPSVEAGDVLAAVLTAAGEGDALARGDAAALAPLVGSRAGGAVASAPLAGHRVHLLRGYRQDADFELAPLADAVRAGDATGALALLRGDPLAGVEYHETVLDPLAVPQAGLLAHWRALGEAPDPHAALQWAGRLRLLTAVREGPQGSRGLNARIEAQLGGHPIGAAPAYFPGRLLLITENSYRHRLFNGDVGVVLRDAGGALVAWFADGAGDVRGFHPSALPAHESAFAMTVHKAQGSEFDEVWLQLPARDARVLSRELVYTGLTRARRRLHLAGSEAVLRAALARHAQRISGLAWRLGGREALPPPAPVLAPAQGSLF